MRALEGARLPSKRAQTRTLIIDDGESGSLLIAAGAPLINNAMHCDVSASVAPRHRWEESGWRSRAATRQLFHSHRPRSAMKALATLRAISTPIIIIQLIISIVGKTVFICFGARDVRGNVDLSPIN